MLLDDKIIKEKTGIDISSIEQGSQEWLDLRLGVITASRVSDILSEPRSKADKEAGKLSESSKSYMMQLISEICIKEHKQLYGKPLDWGVEHEDTARSVFEFMHDKKVIETPFIFGDEELRYGCSPDGLVDKNSGLEIKCPYDNAVFLKFKLLGIDGIKPEYMAQVQFSMWVTNRESWHFVNYDPRMPRDNLHSVLVHRDPAYMQKFDTMIPAFIDEMDKSLNKLGFKFGEQWG